MTCVPFADGRQRLVNSTPSQTPTAQPNDSAGLVYLNNRYHDPTAAGMLMGLLTVATRAGLAALIA